MKFATRLALFLTLTLAAVQTTTVLVGYAVSRAELADKGQAELANAAQLFRVQLQRHFARASDAVRVLSLDFALRGAIAHDDLATIKSALANHGQRAGANRMMLVRLDGSIAEDTGGGNYRGRAFLFGDLLARAEEDGRAAAMADVDGQLRWIIAATVDALTQATFRARVLKHPPSACRTVMVTWPVLLTFRSSTTPDLPAWTPPVTVQASPFCTVGEGVSS